MRTDAERYEWLKHWLLTTGKARWIELAESDSEPFVMGTDFYGESFEAAVDTLPEVHYKFHTVLSANNRRSMSGKNRRSRLDQAQLSGQIHYDVPKPTGSPCICWTSGALSPLLHCNDRNHWCHIDQPAEEPYVNQT